jgi:sister chromatid cohesion protein DCC1
MQEMDECRALIPSSATTLKIWEAILTSATAESIALTEPLDLTDVSSIAKKHDEWPTELITAVVISICTNPAGTNSIVQVDETKCARKVGEMLLRERTQSGRSSTSLKSFTETWADLLPENWRARADIGLLEGSCIIENGGQDVSFIESSGTNGPSVSAGATPEAKSTLGAKRKWHEKFRTSKKTA